MNAATVQPDVAELVEAYRVRGGFGFWEIADADPDRPAVVDVDGSTTTFGQLRDLAHRISHGLRAQGLADGMPARAPARRRQGSVMLYTSGTTGRPKGVRKPLPQASPERSLAAMVGMLPRMLGRPGEQGWADGSGVHLVVAPLYHAAPNTYGHLALHLGHSLVLMDKWTLQSFLELVQRHRVTATHMVPIMFHRLLALPEAERRRHDLSSLTRIVHAGAPCPVHVKQAMMDWTIRAERAAAGGA